MQDLDCLFNDWEARSLKAQDKVVKRLLPLLDAQKSKEALQRTFIAKPLSIFGRAELIAQFFTGFGGGSGAAGGGGGALTIS